MIQFFIQQHKLMNMILLGVIVVGVYYFINGQKEGFPEIGLDQIYITTSYPGVSAKDIDALITSKIEDAIESVEGLEDIFSSSSQGISTIIITVDTINSGLNLNEVSWKIRDEIDLIKRDLPTDLQNDPVVRTINFREVIPIIQVFIAGNRDFNELKSISKEFSSLVGDIPGVSKTEKVNYPKTQVWISVDPEKLKKYQIDISEVASAVRSANVNLPSGTLKQNNEEILIKTLNPLRNISDIEDIVIRGNDNFQTIRVKDVARSAITPEEINRVLESDGLAGVGVSVFKTLNGDVIKSATAVKSLVKKYQELYPDLNIFYIRDTSFYVERRLNILGNNATIGLILVFFCLIIFFEFRVTFWTTLGIPVALCFTIIVCYLLGITLNLMSMFGFIIVLGMLVDDAIIVAENIYQKYEKGMPLMEASVSGTQEMLVPILAILATTSAAFLPLMTLPGIFGKVLGIIPQVVVLALLASFIESILILPGHIAHMRDRNVSHKKDQEKWQKKFSDSPYNMNSERVPDFGFTLTDSETASMPNQKQKKGPGEKRQWFNKIRNLYTGILNRLTKRPFLSAGMIIVLCITIVGGLGSRLPFIFFSGETEDIIINIEIDKKSTLKKTQIVLRELEKQLRQKLGDDVREYFSTTGSTQERDQAQIRIRTYVGHVYMTLLPTAQRKYSETEIVQIAEETAQTLPEVLNTYVITVAGGPPPGNPVEVSLSFNNIDSMEKAKRLANKIKDFIIPIPNTVSEKVSYEEGKEEITLTPNLAKAAAYGVNADQIGNIAGSSFRGASTTALNNFSGVNEEVEVIVKLDEDKISQSTITNLSIKNLRGRTLNVDPFVSTTVTLGEGRINKENGRYNIKVTSQLEDKGNREYTGERINQEIRKQIPEWEKEFPEAEITLGGEQQEQQELMAASIRALLLSLFGVLVVLVAVFKSYLQPFIIMSVLPFITVGVTIGLYINSVPIGLMPFLGMIALSGVVVNDSIVMVDLINKKRKEHHTRPLREIVVEAGGQRLRAILMTTITTIVGLTPIAYGIGGAEPFIAPMAITFLWGMIFSSLLILFLIPNFYLIVERIGKIFRRSPTSPH